MGGGGVRSVDRVVVVGGGQVCRQGGGGGGGQVCRQGGGGGSGL